MAVTSALVIGSAATTGYSIYTQNKADKRSAAAQQAVLASRPSAQDDQAKANQSALDAQAAQRRKASSALGRGSTILTGPSGVPNQPPPASKTLLGL